MIKGDLVWDSHSNLATQINNFFGFSMYVHAFNVVRQKEMHSKDPLMTEPNIFKAEMAVWKLRRHKSPIIDHIPAELIKTGGKKIRSEIHKLLNRLNAELNPILH
jgi:hypothetical protein